MWFRSTQNTVLLYSVQQSLNSREVRLSTHPNGLYVGMGEATLWVTGCAFVRCLCITQTRNKSHFAQKW